MKNEFWMRLISRLLKAVFSWPRSFQRFKLAALTPLFFALLFGLRLRVEGRPFSLDFSPVSPDTAALIAVIVLFLFALIADLLVMWRMTNEQAELRAMIRDPNVPDDVKRSIASRLEL